MSNLRWILLFAGFAILLLLYFSGRPRKATAQDGQGRRDPDDLDNRMGHGNTGLMPAGATEMPLGGYYQTDPLLDAQNLSEPMHDQGAEPGQLYDDQQYGGPQYGSQAGPQYLETTDGFNDMDPADMVRPGGGYADNAMPSEGLPVNSPDNQYRVPSDPQQYPDDPSYELPANTPAASDYGNLAAVEAPAAPPAAPTTLGGKLDAFSARFTSRRKKATTANKGTAADESDNPMVILLHVAAPEGQMIDGQLLLQVFEQRRYHFGEKNIFHSLHQGKTVFSIAKMVEPGFFDVNDISSFETPGLLLILQLPGPVAGEAAFEVLISEARELSDALGCRVLDSKRSTLSRQTTQHLRESVSNYVHRQKYFSKANAS